MKPSKKPVRLLHAARRWLQGKLTPAQKPQPAKPRAVFSQEEENARQTAFTFAVIALGAKLAAVDEPAKPEEFAAFFNLFPMPEQEKAKIEKLFYLAAQDNITPAHYARQITHHFPGRIALTEELITRLGKLALVDGRINEAEKNYIEHVASILKVDETRVHDSLAPRYKTNSTDPYVLLGITRKTPVGDIKKIYHDRIRELHPDLLTARGHSEQDITAAASDLAAVSEAYRTIAKKRGIK